MKTNVATYYVVKTPSYTNSAGQTVEATEDLYNEAAFQKKNKTLIEAKEAPLTPDMVQSFGLPEAETIEDISTLCPSTEIQVVLFNRAASLKMLNEIRAKMLKDEDFTPVDGVFDLTSVISEPSERRSASPEQKIEKLLSGLSEDAIARIMQKIMEKQTAPTSA